MFTFHDEILSAISCLAAFFYYEQLIQGKGPALRRFLVLLVVSLVSPTLTVMISRFNIGYYFSATGALAILVILIFISQYEGNIFSRIAAYAVTDLAISVPSIFSVLITNLMLPDNIDYLQPTQKSHALIMYANMFFMEALIFPLYFKLVKLFKHRIHLSVMQVRLTALLYFTTVLVSRTNTFNKTILDILIATAYCFIFLSAIGIYLYYHQTSALKYENHYLKLYSHIQKEHYLALKYQLQELTRLHTYINDQIQTASQYADSNEVIAAYLKDLQYKYNTYYPTQHTGHLLIDLIIDNQLEICRSKKVAADIQTAQLPPNCRIDITAEYFSELMEQLSIWIWENRPQEGATQLKITGQLIDQNYQLEIATILHPAQRLLNHLKHLITESTPVKPITITLPIIRQNQ